MRHGVAKKGSADMDIAQKIIDARKENNITQCDLADRTGINQSIISRIERRKTKPSIGMLQRIAEGMEMDLEINFKKR